MLKRALLLLVAALAVSRARCVTDAAALRAIAQSASVSSRATLSMAAARSAGLLGYYAEILQRSLETQDPQNALEVWAEPALLVANGALVLALDVRRRGVAASSQRAVRSV